MPANHVLEQALSPGVAGIPKDLFRNCKGVVLISVVEVGFIFSGNLGTGIIVAKKSDGTWSKPAACGLTGVGWGIIVGGSVKDLIVFILDDTTMEGVAGDTGIKMGGQMELTLGPWGRTTRFDIGVSNRGISSTFSIAYSKGAFLGINIEGALVGSRNAVNTSFYGKEVTGTSIAPRIASCSCCCLYTCAREGTLLMVAFHIFPWANALNVSIYQHVRFCSKRPALMLRSPPIR